MEKFMADPDPTKAGASNYESEFARGPGIMAKESQGHPRIPVDRKGVDEQAMIMRRAGLKEAAGEVVSRTETWNPDSKMIDIVVVTYDEEQARRDYTGEG